MKGQLSWGSVAKSELPPPPSSMVSNFWTRNWTNPTSTAAAAAANQQSLGDAGHLHCARSQWQLSAAYDLRLECTLAHRTECLVREAQLGEGIELLRNLLTLPPAAARVETAGEPMPDLHLHLETESTQRTLIRLISGEMARLTADSNVAYVDALMDLWLTFVFARQEEQSRSLTESSELPPCSSLREPYEPPETERSMHLSSQESMELDALAISTASPTQPPAVPQNSIPIASLKQLVDYIMSAPITVVHYNILLTV